MRRLVQASPFPERRSRRLRLPSCPGVSCGAPETMRAIYASTSSVVQAGLDLGLAGVCIQGLRRPPGHHVPGPCLPLVPRARCASSRALDPFSMPVASCGPAWAECRRPAPPACVCFRLARPCRPSQGGWNLTRASNRKRWVITALAFSLRSREPSVRRESGAAACAWIASIVVERLRRKLTSPSASVMTRRADTAVATCRAGLRSIAYSAGRTLRYFCSAAAAGIPTCICFSAPIPVPLTKNAS